MDNKILAIDIGSSKICATIAEIHNSEPRIIGYSNQRSQGIRKGMIVNIELASQTIRSAIAEVKRMSGVDDIKKAIVSISSAYTKNFNSSGVVSIANGEITVKEVSRALETAIYNSAIPPECDTIHVLPYRFKLDDQDYIEDPDGMIGSRLEVFVHIVTAKKSSIENIKKVVRLAGVEVENIVLSSYASSIATLLPDEKESGAVCIDMGGSTCEAMIYLGNSMHYNYFLGVGSNHITTDISEAISTSLAASEDIKIQYADPIKFDENHSDEHANLEVPSIGDNSKHLASLETVQKVVHLRIIETFNILSQAIKRSGLEEHVSAIILTGGMTKMRNIKKIAEMFFSKIPVRIAKPLPIEGIVENFQDETNSTIAGLIFYGVGRHTNYEKDSQKNIRYKKSHLLKSVSLPKNDDFSPVTDLRNLTNNYQKEEKSSQKIAIIEGTKPSKAGWKSKLRDFANKLF